MDILSELLNRKPSRRSFLAGAGAAGAATLVAGCGGSSTPPATTTSTPTPAVTDADILTFALNLEYLEAEFYLRAATGSGLSPADSASSAQAAGAVTGGAQVPNLPAAEQNILNEIAFDEQAHVRFLRSALTSAGITPVSRPAIDLTAFAGLATAAGITAAFNPFGDFDSFLVGAFVFEDVGVTAYHGASGMISTAGIASGYLSAAAGILAVEAYHAAYVRTALTGRSIAAAAASTPYPYLGLANQVSALRGTLGGGNETALVLPTSLTTPSAIVAADMQNAIAFSRTVDQVLHIVYGTGNGAGVKSGGFCPSGLNGNITTTAS